MIQRTDALAVVPATLLVMLALAHNTVASELFTGVTTDVDTGGAGAVIEYHLDPVRTGENWAYGPAAAVRVDNDGDAWGGAGVAGAYRLGNGWWLQGSFMPGLYRAGETDLGGALEFRSKIGLAFELSSDITFSIAIDHMSNGGLRTENPGSDAITLGIQYQSLGSFSF